MPWYVIRTKPQHELKSARLLERAGLEVYCPVVNEVRQWSDRKKKITLPLFRSYLFINIQEKDRGQVYDAPGVIGYLQWLGKPAIARDDEIEAIRAWLNNDRLDNFKVGILKKGDEVEIKSGKMAHQKAVVQEVGSKKLRLILKDLGWTLTANVQDVI